MFDILGNYYCGLCFNYASTWIRWVCLIIGPWFSNGMLLYFHNKHGWSISNTCSAYYDYLSICLDHLSLKNSIGIKNNYKLDEHIYWYFIILIEHHKKFRELFLVDLNHYQMISNGNTLDLLFINLIKDVPVLKPNETCSSEHFKITFEIKLDISKKKTVTR